MDKLELWKSEEAAQYLADIGISSSSGSSGGGSSSSGDRAGASELTEKEKATRKYIRLLAEQSTKAYGALWSALPPAPIAPLSSPYAFRLITCCELTLETSVLVC